MNEIEIQWGGNGKYTIKGSLTPYNPGGPDEPPSGPDAEIDEIIFDKLPIHPREWAARGFDDSTILQIEAAMIEAATQQSIDSYTDAMEQAADLRRDELRADE